MRFITEDSAPSIAAATVAGAVEATGASAVKIFGRRDAARSGDELGGDVDLDPRARDVEFELADVEVEHVIGRRRRVAADLAREPGVLETLGQPRLDDQRQAVGPFRPRQRRHLLRAGAHQDAVAVEIERGERLGDAHPRAAAHAPARAWRR